MNNTFDFKRFGQVLAIDGRKHFRSFGIGMIVSVCLPVILWVASLVFNFNIDSETRGNFIGGFLVAIIMLVPEILYGKANLSREGVGFAMLPATAAEKFFSMFFYCSILTPIVCGLGCWGVDSLMTLMPFGGFKEFVNLPIDSRVPQNITIRAYIYMYILVLLWSSCFLLGNMVFKKNKAAKTGGWLLLTFFVIILMTMIPLINRPLAHFMLDVSVEDTVLYQRVIIFATIIMVVLLDYLTYRKIKTQKY